MSWLQTMKVTLHLFMCKKKKKKTLLKNGSSLFLSQKYENKKAASSQKGGAAAVLAGSMRSVHGMFTADGPQFSSTSLRTQDKNV